MANNDLLASIKNRGQEKISDQNMEFINKTLKMLLEPIGVILHAKKGIDDGNECIFFYDKIEYLDESNPHNQDYWCYMVCKNTEDNNWYYVYLKHNSGTYWEPPDDEPIESKESFCSPGVAFKELVNMLFNDQINGIAETCGDWTDQ